MTAKYHTDAERTGWVGVDLDGVLVEWDPKYLPGLGPPIIHGITLVRRLLAAGKEVRIFTARIQPSPGDPEWWAEIRRLGFDALEPWVASQIAMIDKFCIDHFQTTLRITASKDWRMTTCYDDRSVQMIPNTGESLGEIAAQELRRVSQELRQLADTFHADDH